jgi:flagellar biosynthesis protein
MSHVPPSRPEGNSATVAVALRHDRDEDTAPRVVASGRGRTAETILDIAFASGIKVREDGDLAEMLQAVDIGSEIPLAAFAAVAEILARLYQANEAAGAGEGA